MCFAQDQNGRKGKNMWVSKSECIAAYQSGNYLYYYPKNFHNKNRYPVDEKGRTGAPAKHDAVVQMETANETKFVIIPENTMLRFENGIPYAHDACGNKIFSFSYLEKRKDPSISSKLRNEYIDTEDSTNNETTSSEVSQNNSRGNTNASCVDYRQITSGSTQVYVVPSGVGFYPSYNNYYSGGYYRTTGYNRTYTVGGGTYRVGGQSTRTNRIR